MVQSHLVVLHATRDILRLDACRWALMCVTDVAEFTAAVRTFVDKELWGQAKPAGAKGHAH